METGWGRRRRGGGGDGGGTPPETREGHPTQHGIRRDTRLPHPLRCFSDTRLVHPLRCVSDSYKEEPRTDLESVCQPDTPPFGFGRDPLFGSRDKPEVSETMVEGGVERE